MAWMEMVHNLKNWVYALYVLPHVLKKEINIYSSTADSKKIRFKCLKTMFFTSFVTNLDQKSANSSCHSSFNADFAGSSYLQYMFPQLTFNLSSVCSVHRALGFSRFQLYILSNSTDNGVKDPFWIHLPLTEQNHLAKLAEPVDSLAGIHAFKTVLRRRL